jgi:two-component system sensor histidine kinase RegB
MPAPIAAPSSPQTPTIEAPPVEGGLAPARTQAVLRWLVPLRFLSAAGQAVAIAIAYRWLALPLPYPRLWLLPAILVASNLLLVRLRRRAPDRAARLVVPTLVFDVALFTLLLAWSGGPDSPFSALYVVQIVLATMTGHRGATWVVALAAAALYGLVFVAGAPAHFWHAPVWPGATVGLHALGMWVAVLVVAVVITFFMTRIVATLAEREAEMRRLTELAARNARLASLTTLAAGAAHELGSPLGTIAVIARELERASGRPSEANADAATLRADLAEDAKLLRHEVERCRGILDRMRARAADELHAAERTLVAADLEEVLLAHLDAAERARVRLSTTIAPATPIGPRFDVAEVIGPILRNALDASRPDDAVELEVDFEAGQLCARVRDHGAGMDDSTLEHVGEPFFTTRPPGQGTGLGLFVVNLHLERLGGSLRFASAPGRGTTATVAWPIATGGATGGTMGASGERRERKRVVA